VVARGRASVMVCAADVTVPAVKHQQGKGRGDRLASGLSMISSIVCLISWLD
jgi:hypothetical protein